jgi:hypothetical protein
MKILERLERMALVEGRVTDRQALREAATIISEAYGLLQAVAVSSMSRNNAENLACEVIQMIEKDND